ncbi:MAG: Crp/Fnr family transcriptional regulator [Saprospiraceae bacterium]|nr:Crp/Fnr family transcriptional regulator [Saprospiraceae bacterium]
MQDSSKILMLRQSSLFKHLNETEIAQLARHSNLKRIKKNQFIYHNQQEIQYVYVIEKGSIKCGMETSSGKILIKHIHYDQEVFGENVFAGIKRNDFAQAMQDSVLLVIPASLFRSSISKNAEFAAEIMQLIITRLNHVEERMHNFVFKKAKERIYNFIVTSGRARGIKIGLDECLINHGMSHKEIAYLTDTSRQTVARVLGELKRDNLIHFSPRKPSKILIRSMEW